MGLKYKNLINLVVDDNNLRLAYKQARKNKRYKKDVLIFKERLEYNLQQIKKEILDKTYEIGEYRNFKIYIPKEREISALPFKDRVVQHALCNIIEPLFNKYMFPCSYACRKGMGTHRCMFKAKQIIQSVFKNKECYYLKIDFKKFFPSIDRSVLYQEINRKIKDKHILWLLNKIIPPTGTGIPIGNLTSQLFANVYGTIFDRFIKQSLRVKYYVRYMDDSVIFSENKSYLKILKNIIEEFIHIKLKMIFSKWYIENIHKGLNFVGYRIFKNKVLIRKSSVIRCKRKIKSYLYHRDYTQLYKSLVSWFGYIQWADTYNLRQYIRIGIINLWQMKTEI
jgi:retron-type reverse transcriptase